jgi:hypothetical protein
MTLRLICPDSVAGKSGFKLFLPKNSFFNPFVYQKHCINRDKSIYDLKKTKKLPKNQNRSKLKKSTRAHICFFMNFKSKKTLTMNFPY